MKHLGLAKLHELMYPIDHEELENEEPVNDVRPTKRTLQHHLKSFYLPQVRYNSHIHKNISSYKNMVP